jgi:hypothetical protein
VLHHGGAELSCVPRGKSAIYPHPPIFPAKNLKTRELQANFFLPNFRITKPEGNPLTGIGTLCGVNSWGCKENAKKFA